VEVAAKHGVSVAALKYHFYNGKRAAAKRASTPRVLPVRLKSERSGAVVEAEFGSKCGDSNPQYRLEKSYRNIGIPISRSTLCGLIHRGAAELKPLHNAALKLVPTASDVHADETSMRQQDLEGRSYIWSFRHSRACRVSLRSESQRIHSEAGARRLARSARRRHVHRLQRGDEARRKASCWMHRARSAEIVRATRAPRDQGSARLDQRHLSRRLTMEEFSALLG